MKIIIILLIIVLIFGGCAPLSDSESKTLSDVDVTDQSPESNDRKDSVILIGCLENNLPYYGLSNDELVGPGIEFVKLIFDELGYDYEFVVLPWNRLIASMENGSIDLLLDTIHKVEREAFLDYSRYPFLVQVDKLYKLKERDIRYDGSFSSISGYTVGLVGGYSYGNYIDMAKENGEFEYDETGDYVENIEKLLRGRVDLIISNTLAASSYIDYEVFESLDPFITETYAYVTFSKVNDLTALRDEYDEVYKKLIDNGTIQNMLNEYNLYEIGEAIKTYDPKDYDIK